MATLLVSKLSRTLWDCLPERTHMKTTIDKEIIELLKKDSEDETPVWIKLTIPFPHQIKSDFNIIVEYTPIDFPPHLMSGWKDED
jgi:hypothetical protein